MRKLAEFFHEGNRTLFAGLLAAVFFAGLIVVAGPNSMDQPAFAAEPPPVSQELVADKMSPGPGEKGGPPKDRARPLERASFCVGVDVRGIPYPGCTSGHRCSAMVNGQPCGRMNSGLKCQTVSNGSGVCACQCIK